MTTEATALIKSLIRFEQTSITELMTALDAVRDEAIRDNNWQQFFKYSRYYYQAKELHELLNKSV